MGIPFVIGFVLLGVLSGNSPDYKSSDSKILDWYANHGHRVADIAGIFVVAVSAVLLGRVPLKRALAYDLAPAGGRGLCGEVKREVYGGTHTPCRCA